MKRAPEDDLLRELARAPDTDLAHRGTAAASSEANLAPGTELGPYRVEELLGRGGMGAVYAARDGRLEREVAIKIVSGLDDLALRRFDREARLLASLSHPNVVTVHDVGRVGDTPYLVLERLRGATLRARLAAGPLPANELAVLGAHIARGLAAAHARGIVHRDLKPENVFLCSDGTVKVLDFGIAKEMRAGHDVTEAGAIIGTLDYMSPEQLRADELDARSDLFALGAILHEALSGHSTFRRASPAETISAILRDEPAPLSATTTVARAVLDVARACLHKTTTSRPRDAAAVSVSLASIAEMKEERSHEPLEIERTMPETRYAHNGDVAIAYQVIGEGPIDVVMVPGFVSNVEHWWEEPEGRRLLSGIAANARLILFDKRGTGLSDRVPESNIPTIERRMSDVRAVMDAASSRRAVLFGISEGGPMAMLFAATERARTAGLILYGTTPFFQDRPDAPNLEKLRAMVEKGWGTGVTMELFAPSVMGDPRMRRWFARWERSGASPGAARALLAMMMGVDVRPVLAQIDVPTLIMHRVSDAAIDVSAARYMAKKIAGARYYEQPDGDHVPCFGDTDGLLREIAAFLQERARHA